MSELIIGSMTDSKAVARIRASQLIWAQTAHATKELFRNPIAPLISLVLPVLFLVVTALVAGSVPGQTGGIHALVPSAAVFAATMASFVTLSHSIALAKEQGILKRLHGTPLPPWAYLGGKIASSALVSVLGTGLMVAVAMTAYGLTVSPIALPAILFSLLLGIVCLASLGLAIAMLLSSSQSVIGATLGVFILAAFVSDLFVTGTSLPLWLDAVGWALPLRHFVAALSFAFEPGAAMPALSHLTAMAAWGVLGAFVAVKRFDKEPSLLVSARTTGSTRVVSRLGTALRFGWPSWAGMAWGQMRQANLGVWREPIFAFFALAFPTVFVVLLPIVTGNPEIEGVRFSRTMLTSMPVFGVALTAYVALANSLATARDKGVLERLRGTPLAPSAFFAGRMASVFWVAGITVSIVLVAGRLVHGEVVPPAHLPALAFVLLVGTATFAALGMAVAAMTPNAESVSAVTLATLLPLKFISDVFPLGGALPSFVESIGWLFPLKHMVHGVGSAMDLGHLAWQHLAVIALWGVVATVVASVRLRWSRGAN